MAFLDVCSKWPLVVVPRQDAADWWKLLSKKWTSGCHPNENFGSWGTRVRSDIPRFFYKVVKKILILQLWKINESLEWIFEVAISPKYSVAKTTQHMIYSPKLLISTPTQQVFCPEYCQLNTMPLDQGKNERNHTNFTCQSSFLPIQNRSNSQRPSPPLSSHPTVTHMQLCCVKDRFFRPFRSASCTSLKAKSQTVLSWEVVQVPRLHTRNRPGLIQASWAPAVFAAYF